jgi:hypothetical protein
VDEAVRRPEDDRRADDRLGHAAVADADVEALPGRQLLLRRDLQLLAVAGEGRGLAVDGHRADLELLEVEVEARQGLHGHRPDPVDGIEPVGRRVVGEGEVVVADVEAAVALEREVGIADPGRPGWSGRAQGARAARPRRVGGRPEAAAGGRRAALAGCRPDAGGRVGGRRRARHDQQ